jgi:tripartite-type tricarboxylate transporter receptor subunit TctC
LLNTLVSEIFTRECRAKSREQYAKEGWKSIEARVLTRAARPDGRCGGAVSAMFNRIERRRKALGALLLPVCRSPPFAPCQQLSPYAPEISRRQFVNLITGAAALPAFSRIARAETYPSRPVRIIVGFPPGGAADVTARLIGQWLSERLGQPFIIENLSGAGTNIGTEAVAKSPADGYTLLLVSVANTVNATLYETLNFDFIRDITPVAGLVRGPLVMEVNPSVPATTVPEFIAYAKANPGITNIASAGIGTPGHMASELFQLLTGLDLLDVPYRGGAPALTDLLAGQVHVIFDNLPTSLEYIRAGKLRPLAVTTMTRSDTLPDLPTVAEFVPGYEVSSWFGIGAPRNTPTQVVDKLNAEINAGLAAPKLKAHLTDLGETPLMRSPTDFGKLIVEETEKWGRVIRAANIKPERLIRGLR